ncbi:MAG: DUF1801 domain-containing protein [Bacteroidia bacterium]|nr:DUF1801 domain-containing protein [Bacteroidia bacterium]
MAKPNKTQATNNNVLDFINQQPENRRADCLRLVELFSAITNAPAVMWGSSIVGFGNYHYKYESGREGDFFHAGFSPRKQNLTIYIMAGFGNESIMKRLGKYKTGKSCLYVKKLEDIDEAVLTELVEFSIEKINKRYPPAKEV